MGGDGERCLLWQLRQWQRYWSNGGPLMEYLTASQKQEPVNVSSLLMPVFAVSFPPLESPLVSM